MQGNTIPSYFNQSTSAITEETVATPPSAHEAAVGIAINFHSAEFNHIDDLNDYSGNYRTFQSLEGVVTADMRHQKERLSGRNVVDAAVANASPSQEIEGDANETATIDTAPPLSVNYQGRILSCAGGGPPLSHYAPRMHPTNSFKEMGMQIEEEGRFPRPQSVVFLNNCCLHGRSHTLDCRQCLAICPFDAIQSVNQTISIDHNRCQGCGGCALVCPADAMQMAHPYQQELLGVLRHMLEDRSASIALAPTLVISDLETVDVNKFIEIGEGNHVRQVHFAGKQIGYFGLEMLLAALVYGAGTVIVACGAQNPTEIREAAYRQSQMGRVILQGLGMPENKIRFIVITPENKQSEKVISATTGSEARLDNCLSSSAIVFPQSDKRTLTRLVTQHLYNQSGVRQPWIPLPAGSPFGTVTVDSATCTMCMACTVVCPSGALSAKDNIPSLEFLESQCRQCRLCEETCPEGAIHLRPRMLCDPDTVATPVALNESDPVRCIECGISFASQAMVKRIQSKLTGHWMYVADRQLRRLQMCRTCRTRDALASQDMNSWSRRQE